jgi:hypothetical protein
LMVADSNPIDSVDAIPMELIILKWRILIAKRLKMQVPDYTQEMMTLIQQVYMTFGQTANAEIIAKKAQTLKG